MIIRSGRTSDQGDCGTFPNAAGALGVGLPTPPLLRPKVSEELGRPPVGRLCGVRRPAHSADRKASRQPISSNLGW